MSTFWASFLLLHLGGPDTITSFALEDSEFWLRHLARLILQVQATAYIFYQSLPNKLCVIMVFLVGSIKYVERTRALFLASMNQFGCSVLPKPDPGPDFEEVMEMSSSMTLEQVETQSIWTSSLHRDTKSHNPSSFKKFKPELFDSCYVMFWW